MEGDLADGLGILVFLILESENYVCRIFHRCALENEGENLLLCCLELRLPLACLDAFRMEAPGGK